MNFPKSIVVGTAGMGVWYSSDFGQTWIRPWEGIYSEMRVWAVSSHPQVPGEFLVGSDKGIWKWTFKGLSQEAIVFNHEVFDKESEWAHLPSELDGLCVWSLARSPSNPDVILAGTQYPAAVYRSEDGGVSWVKLPLKLGDVSAMVVFPRVTKVVFDPNDESTIFVGVEVGGLFRSRDAGRTWEKLELPAGIEDIHDVTVPPHLRGVVMVATNAGVLRSDDRGGNWRELLFPNTGPRRYTRALVYSRPGTVYVTHGNGPPGSWGKLLRSRDDGETWADVPLPVATNSTLWCLAQKPDDANVICLCSNLGQIFVTRDEGETWTKTERELGEIRAVAWTS